MIAAAVVLVVVVGGAAACLVYRGLSGYMAAITGLKASSSRMTDRAGGMEEEAEEDVLGVVVMAVVRAWRSRTGRWRACPSRPCSCSTTGRQGGRGTLG